MRNDGRLLTALVVAAAVTLAGCRQDMHDAPRYEVYEANASFPDGRASRNLPVGTVARGQLRDDEHLFTGKINGVPAQTFPFAIGAAEIQRGRERFNIYCTPCHGLLGDGKGMVVQRGLRQAASFHQDRLREEKVGYFFDVITNGFGLMAGYRWPIPPADRWAIITHVRELQRKRLATAPAAAEATANKAAGTLGGAK